MALGRFRAAILLRRRQTEGDMQNVLRDFRKELETSVGSTRILRMIFVLMSPANVAQPTILGHMLCALWQYVLGNIVYMECPTLETTKSTLIN